MLRRKRPQAEPSAPVIESATCMHTFRPAPVAAMIERGDQLPANHWAVRAHPTYFMRLVPVRSHEEEENDG
jgi:hypothetical protein